MPFLTQYGATLQAGGIGILETTKETWHTNELPQGEAVQPVAPNAVPQDPKWETDSTPSVSPNSSAIQTGFTTTITNNI